MTEWFWSTEDVAFLESNCPTMTVQTLALHLRCTRKAVWGRLERMGLHALPDTQATLGPWNDERIQRAAKLWLEGASASEIANDLACGLTRNAVIGKLHRMGLSGRKGATHPCANERLRTKELRASTNAASGYVRRVGRPKAHNYPKPPTAEKPAPVKALPTKVAPAPPEPVATVGFMELNSRIHCSWPIGDDWCAEPKAGHFCAFHKRIGTQKSQPAAKEYVRAMRRYA